MPFVFLIVGVTLLVAGVRDTQGKLFKLVQNDFTQRPSFIPWAAALLALGFLGYIEPLKNVTRAFLLLVILGILLSNRGFFVQLTEALKPYTTGSNTK